MLCDICRKKQATIHIQEVVNGSQKVLNLCPECAQVKVGKIAMDTFNLAAVLYNLAGGSVPPQIQPDQSNPASEEAQTAAAVSCPSCHWTIEKLRASNGKLGCPQCYRAFAPLIAEALKNIQRGPRHRGKHPGADGVSGNSHAYLELAHLQHQLDEKVKLEEFEEAAKLRDRINKLKASSRQPLENKER